MHLATRTLAFDGVVPQSSRSGFKQQRGLESRDGQRPERRSNGRPLRGLGHRLPGPLLGRRSVALAAGR